MDIEEKFEKAIARIDEENSKDPNSVMHQGKAYPKELLYSRQMTDWLHKMNPDASIELQLAARSQHICRWTSPRESYPMDRVGYLKWRTELKNFHAQKTAEILSECGFDAMVINGVASLIRKEKVKTDSESQLLEDVVCIVFLENYFQDFSTKHDEQKVIDIIRKTWRKMSPKGQDVALKLEMSDAAGKIVERALEER
ncbi:MAG: DUF4202 domain-containing protein [Bacteroidetes bacterium]|nr:DUF4202 domain-containing protein [Bacteroidota bacterium]MDA1119749.1 DUF4202 domain-containing protein [Bacteroidota bacterium]